MLASEARSAQSLRSWIGEFAGETTNMILTFVFGALALFGIWLTVTTVRSHLRPKQEHGR